MDARRDLPVVVGDIFAAFAAAPMLRHIWVLFDRHACCHVDSIAPASVPPIRRLYLQIPQLGKNRSPQVYKHVPWLDGAAWSLTINQLVS